MSMKKIFYLKKVDGVSTRETLKKILSSKFRFSSPEIITSENGKPYLKNNGELPLHFSVSHTDELLFVVFSDKNVGIDAEKSSRKVEYAPIIKKFPETERAQISSKADFLQNWTAKESAVKWLGGTLGRDLAHLQFVDKQIYYKSLPLPLTISFPAFQEHVVAVCSEEDFTDVQIEPFIE